MIEIEAGSVAFAFLRLLFSQEDTYMMRIEQRADGVAIKRNGGVWSPTLPCTDGGTIPRAEAGTSYLPAVVKAVIGRDHLDG